eukprot:m.157650 g.157650  ORF g.157650 m.157650 type:complete len:448 (-) comp24726_c2_seq1:63-1406(-)
MLCLALSLLLLLFSLLLLLIALLLLLFSFLFFFSLLLLLFFLFVGCCAMFQPLLRCTTGLVRTSLLLRPLVPALVRPLSHTSPPTLSFYDKTVPAAARSQQQKLTVADLWDFGANISEEKLKKSAKFLHKDLPRRIALSILDFQQLPFIIACNPHLREVYEIYTDAFLQLSKYPKITSLQKEEKYISFLKSLNDDHNNVISLLARGCRESAQYIPASELESFLSRTVRSRIGIRMLIEQQLALHSPLDDHLGIIALHFSPYKSIRRCEQVVAEMCRRKYGHCPKVSVQGDLDATFPYIQVHFEYIMLELLKNSFRAVVENHGQGGLGKLPEVDVIVWKNQEDVCIRVADQGGGISDEDMKRIWEYAFTTVNKPTDAEVAPPTNMLGDITSAESAEEPLAGLGVGLPLSKCYSEYFGGRLEVMSLPGFGTDVYLRLRILGPNMKREIE